MVKPSPIRHILVLVDGTESSVHAAEAAIELAHGLGARLTAMAVVDTDTLQHLLSVKILVDAEMGEFEKELSASAQKLLDHVSLHATGRAIKVEEVLVTGASETVVPHEVHARAVDLVCLGGFLSTRVTRALLARQRQQIIDLATCPVLLVK
jgi:nucleotide-binding universal stress UspA family protein